MRFPAAAPQQAVAPPPQSKAPASSERSAADRRLEERISSLQWLAEEEERRQKTLFESRRRATAKEPALPSLSELLERMDAEAQVEATSTPPVAEGSARTGGLAAPRGPPSSFVPRSAAPQVPNLDGLLARLDQEEAQAAGGSSSGAAGVLAVQSLEVVLASIDEDEQGDLSRQIFYSLGSGGPAPEPQRPQDPLSKMIRLVNPSAEPVDLPGRVAQEVSREHSPPIVAQVQPRKARWRSQQVQAKEAGQEPRPVPGRPKADPLLGRGRRLERPPSQGT